MPDTPAATADRQSGWGTLHAFHGFRPWLMTFGPIGAATPFLDEMSFDKPVRCKLSGEVLQSGRLRPKRKDLEWLRGNLRLQSRKQI